MSNELDKIKHSERRHRTQNVISKQMKIAKAKHVVVDEPHKLAKHHALDCGVSNCPLCSSPRKRGELSIQEKRFYQMMGDE
jgi:hypothetical protein